MDVMNYFKNFDYKDFNSYHLIALPLLILGGLLCGICGLFGSDHGLLSRLVLIIIGAAGGYEAYMFYMDNFTKKVPPSNLPPM